MVRGISKEHRKLAIATITSKGQVTIPREVRRSMGLRPGDKIEFVEKNGELKVRKFFTDDPFARWRGFLKDLKGRRSDDLVAEMRGEVDDLDREVFEQIRRERLEGKQADR
jgi:AbrB family looped-hinge helix DNA binding protein